MVRTRIARHLAVAVTMSAALAATVAGVASARDDRRGSRNTCVIDSLRDDPAG